MKQSKQSKYKAVKVYACQHCLYVFHIGVRPTEEIQLHRENFYCRKCKSAVKVQIFDSEKEFRYYKIFFCAIDYEGKPISRVVHHKIYKFSDAYYQDSSTNEIYEGKNRNKADKLITKAKTYKADITLELSVMKDGKPDTEEIVFDVKGYMTERDRARFNRNVKLMKDKFKLDVEVLK